MATTLKYVLKFLRKFKLISVSFRLSLLEKRLSYLEAVVHERQELQREFNELYANGVERIKRDLYTISQRYSVLEATLSEHIDWEEETGERVSEKQHLLSLKRDYWQYQKNYDILSEQLAKHGTDQPLWLINQLNDTREEINKLRIEIDYLEGD